MADHCYVRVDWDDESRVAHIEASDGEHMELTYHEVSLLLTELGKRNPDAACEYDPPTVVGRDDHALD